MTLGFYMMITRRLAFAIPWHPVCARRCDSWGRASEKNSPSAVISWLYLNIGSWWISNSSWWYTSKYLFSNVIPFSARRKAYATLVSSSLRSKRGCICAIREGEVVSMVGQGVLRNPAISMIARGLSTNEPGTRYQRYTLYVRARQELACFYKKLKNVSCEYVR